MSVYVYIEVLNYGHGPISHTFGILVPGCKLQLRVCRMNTLCVCVCVERERERERESM